MPVSKLRKATGAIILGFAVIVWSVLAGIVHIIAKLLRPILPDRHFDEDATDDTRDTDHRVEYIVAGRDLSRNIHFRTPVYAPPGSDEDSDILRDEVMRELSIEDESNLTIHYASRRD